MYWVLDFLLIIIMATALFVGYKRGIVTMLIGTLASVLQFVLIIAGMAGMVLLLYKLSVVDNFAYLLIGVVGETNSLFTTMGITSFDVCQILAMLILAILSAVLSAFVFIYLFKLLKLAVDKIPDTGAFGIVDGVLGLLVYLVIFGGLILAIFGAIHGLAGSGKQFFIGLEEMLHACKICGWLYDINPLNAIFSF